MNRTALYFVFSSVIMLMAVSFGVVIFTENSITNNFLLRIGYLNFCLTFITFYTTFFFAKINIKQAGFIFVLISSLKIIAAMFFYNNMIAKSLFLELELHKKIFILQYLTMLFVEVIFLVKLINLTKNKKNT